MTGKTIVGLVSILVITSAMSPVYAELMSPLDQINNGITNGMIQCNENKVLVESPNGKPACVYDSTAEKLENRGWTVMLSEIITIQSSPRLISELNPSDKIGELYGVGYIPAECIFPTSISVNVPNRVNVGEIFDVTVTPSFELSDAEFKEFNKKFPIKSFIDGKIFIEGYENAEEIWEEVCSYNRHYSIDNPYNYEPSGDGVSFGTVNLDINYYPPFNRYLYLLDGVEINKSVTFQMKIDEPVKFLLNTGNTSDDYYKHDFGKFIIGTGTAHGNGVPIYTSISGDVVNLSNVEFVRGESQDDTVPILSDYGFGAVLPQNHDELVGLGSPSNELPPFEWIAEELETDFKGEDPTTFIKRFGLNQTYVDEFLEAYPQYKIKTQSFNLVLNWILPQVFG